ncbi:MAG: hypothetical protein HZB19_03915 [Chloroflexi bacterium]|nr:hypothetical protein [Chloroflexota bacterium]
MSVEIISVHFPKAGGSSLKKSLLDAYGQESVYLDYKDDPVDPTCQYYIDPEGCRRKANAICDRLEIKIIHGHFNPSKYNQIKNAKSIVFLRHPIDNLISIYFFWKTYKEPSHAIFNYFRDNQLTLIELAKLPAIRYLMSRTYFSDVDMKSFDFIGFQENYSEDLHSLSKLLSIPITENKENINAFVDYSEEVKAIKANKQIMGTLHDCLIEDIMFYENARKIQAAQNYRKNGR